MCLPVSLSSALKKTTKKKQILGVVCLGFGENGVRSPLEKRETIQRHSFVIHSFTIIERERDEKRLIKKKKHHHGGFGRRRRERRRRSGCGVEVRFISNPLFVIILRRGLHFLNIIFPFFPSLFHLKGTTFFKIPIIRKWETRALFESLFSFGWWSRHRRRVKVVS